ncbi:MAG: sulfatase-like hydrolase/transferase [Rikenellaceae bacterium]
MKNYYIPTTIALMGVSFAMAEQKPNILFIYADDQCFESIYGGVDRVDTPNIDRLMAEGTSFMQAHNQGGWSAGVSVASRTMMATGSYLWRAAQMSPKSKFKVGGNNLPPQQPIYEVVQKERPTLWSELMHDAGYETYMAGKWHVDVNAKGLFDHLGHVRAGMPTQHQDCYDRVFDGVTEDKWSPSNPEYGGFWAGGQHWNEVLKDETIGFLDNSKQSDKPFFMYIAFNAPHDPRQSPQEYIDRYPSDEISIPESFCSVYPYADDIGMGAYLRDENIAPFPRNERSVQVNRQEYYALITYMDEKIGEILDHLEITGQADNTYIIFTSDHGIAIGDHGFMGKQNMYERSIRVPLIITGPNVTKGKQVEEFVYLQDIMPTALEIAGVESPDYVDYHSLLPMATGKSRRSAYDYIYGAYLGVQRMVKSRDFKMIIYPNVNVVRLYDLRKDPNELNDLASNPKYKKRLLSLFEELKKLQIETCDPLDVTPYFEAFIETL